MSWQLEQAKIAYQKLNDKYQLLLTHYQAQADEIGRRQRQIDTLFAAIAHGDPSHQAWLEQAIKDHFEDLPVRKP